MQVPKRRGEWKHQQGPADEFLTPDAVQKLKDELARIIHARPAAVSELQRTREMGDLSENFAYTVAKGRVMGMDHRILEIRERLKNAIVLGGNKSGIVEVGSTVEVEVNDKTKTLRVLGTQQADPSQGQISYHSPVGSALMGKMAGDVAIVSANGKKIEYKILKVT
jgi:transcription elongation factor GreA